MKSALLTLLALTTLSSASFAMGLREVTGDVGAIDLQVHEQPPPTNLTVCGR